MIRCLYLLIALCFVLLGTGCPEGSGGGEETCAGCRSLRRHISSQRQKNKELSRRLTNAEDAKNSAIAERNSAIAERNNAIAERDKAIKERDNAKKEAHDRYIILSVIAYSVLGIGVLLIVGFFLMIRNAKKNIPRTVIDNLHCPRCGWEHAPNETICKNCKTHF